MGKTDRIDAKERFAQLGELLDSLELADEVTRRIRREWAFETLGRLDNARLVDDTSFDTLRALDARWGR